MPSTDTTARTTQATLSQRLSSRRALFAEDCYRPLQSSVIGELGPGVCECLGSIVSGSLSSAQNSTRSERVTAL